jgi:hypothetical protein
MMRSSVDLPQPEGPRMTSNSPSLMRTETCFRTSTLPKFLTMSVTVTSAMLEPY